jgi:hypothetical protein
MRLFFARRFKPPVQFTVYKKSRRDHRDHKFGRKLHIRQMLTQSERTPPIYRHAGGVVKYDRESESSQILDLIVC